MSSKILTNRYISPFLTLRRQTVWQLIFIIAIVAIGYVAVQNVRENLSAAGVSVDYSFLSSDAGFDISESLIPFNSSDSYGRVLVAGLLNTILLAVVCIIGATVLGTVMGVLRTSTHWLGAKAALFYIEFMRNLPKLLILLAIYLAAVSGLPRVQNSINLPGGIHISNRAVYFPVLEWGSGAQFLLAVLAIWFVSFVVLSRVARRIQDTTGRQLPVLWPTVSAAAVILVISMLLLGLNYTVLYPELAGFDYGGGGRVSVQFLVLFVTLSIYHGGQVAELIRGAIEAVPPGQFEAAKSMGFSYFKMMRLIILPQALRIVVPPMGNQYLNITKNTSIALAVGYSDLVSVTTTSINQTFRPIELMTLSMLIYLGICLIVSALINRYNARVTLGGAK